MCKLEALDQFLFISSERIRLKIMGSASNHIFYFIESFSFIHMIKLATELLLSTTMIGGMDSVVGPQCIYLPISLFGNQ